MTVITHKLRKTEFIVLLIYKDFPGLAPRPPHRQISIVESIFSLFAIKHAELCKFMLRVYKLCPCSSMILKLVFIFSSENSDVPSPLCFYLERISPWDCHEDLCTEKLVSMKQIPAIFATKISSYVSSCSKCTYQFWIY